MVTTIFSDGAEFKQTFGKGLQSSTTIETTLLNSNGGTLSADVISIATAGINGLVSARIMLFIDCLNQEISQNGL